jgi:hypothetical protein
MGDAVTRMEKIVEDSVGPSQSPPIGPRAGQVQTPVPVPLPLSPSKGKGGRDFGGKERDKEKERERDKEGSLHGSRTGSGISTRQFIDREIDRERERGAGTGVVVISSEALSKYKVLTVGKYHPFVAPSSSSAAATDLEKGRQKVIDREREKENENENANYNVSSKEVEKKEEGRIDRMLKFGGDGLSSERERARDRDKDKDRGGEDTVTRSAICLRGRSRIKYS